jgi:hypothetical protein
VGGTQSLLSNFEATATVLSGHRLKGKVSPHKPDFPAKTFNSSPGLVEEHGLTRILTPNAMAPCSRETLINHARDLGPGIEAKQSLQLWAACPSQMSGP